MMDNAEINKHFNKFTDHEASLRKLEKVSFNKLSSRILTLNIAGFTGALGYIGILLEKLALGPLQQFCVYATLISFGIGLVCGIVISLADWINLLIPIQKFKKTREEKFCAALIQKVSSGAALEEALEITPARIKLQWVKIGGLLLSGIVFIAGMVFSLPPLSNLINSHSEKKPAVSSYTLINLNTFAS